jgi:hypothetical protein
VLWAIIAALDNSKNRVYYSALNTPCGLRVHLASLQTYWRTCELLQSTLLFEENMSLPARNMRETEIRGEGSYTSIEGLYPVANRAPRSNKFNAKAADKL